MQRAAEQVAPGALSRSNATEEQSPGLSRAPRRRTGAIKDEIVIPEGVGDGRVWKWMAMDPGPPGTLYALVGGQEIKPKTEVSANASLGSWAFPAGPGWDYRYEKTNFGFGRTIVDRIFGGEANCGGAFGEHNDNRC